MTTDQEASGGRHSSRFAKRGALIGLGTALLADLVGLAFGLSDDGFGWAFEMPAVALSGLIGLTASVGGLILGILRLTHQRGREVGTWFTLAGVGITGVGGLLLILLALAASASV